MLAIGLLCADNLYGQERGISWDLARARASQISKISYGLWFGLEEGAKECRGRATIDFDLTGTEKLVLDADLLQVEAVSVNGKEVSVGLGYQEVEDHLVFDKTLLSTGKNRIEIGFRAKAAPTGAPLTLFHDKKTGKDYLYTLVVPADAHRLFPCFDQPDLKARFTLELTVPSSWVAVGNGAEVGAPVMEKGRKHYRFVQSKPLSTYLFAFAAGPFMQLEGPTLERSGGQGIRTRLFLRESAKSEPDIQRIYRLHQQALGKLGSYFGIPYPFGKLDIVLCPGFPYSGMEHAGAIFYRENALVYDKKPTLAQELRRSTLIYHELSHQWFGNLVTMKWFDDLWLKEGFATFIGYKLLDELEPKQRAWLRFLQRVKPSAYRVDATRGTTPVYQSLQNLDDAKSQYGAIVYNKAPAILRELEHRIGPETFRAGVRIFLETHAYGNATWRDLLAAFEKAGAKGLGDWSRWWILEAGMPEIRCEWKQTDGRITRFRVLQTSAQGWTKDSWPMDLTLLLMSKGGKTRWVPVRIHGAETEIRQLSGTPAPAWVLPNPDDIAYGRFVIDKQSLPALSAWLPGCKDPMLRSVGHGALYQTLRAGGVSPSTFFERAIDMLGTETDPQARSSQLASLRFCLRTLPLPQKDRAERRLRKLLLQGLQTGRYHGNEEVPIDNLFRLGTDEATQAYAWQLLELRKTDHGFQPSAREIFAAAAHLIANRDPRIEPWLLALETERGWFADLSQGKPSESLRHAIGKDLEKLLYIARAAHPEPRLKKAYFLSYLREDDPPEQWIQQSLANFHWQGQEDVTRLYLTPALQRVQWVKKHRKIFFMPSWLDAFINGHDSKTALHEVEGFLEKNKPALPVDILRKLLQSLDELRRVVRIREQWYPR